MPHPAAIASTLDGLDRSWSKALLWLAAAWSYLVLHPYMGITHDTQLYTLLALNHLHPDLYGNDVFVRFGSQDDYTVFTPLFASAIKLLGVEPAAAVLTAASHAALLAAALFLARSILPATHALLALLLLLALHGYYGPQKIFSILETFATPRILAEAAVLAGIAAWLKTWRIASIVLLAFAMLIHPIMGLAGPAFILAFEFWSRRWWKLWLLAPCGLALALIAGLAGLIPANWILDPSWRSVVVSRADYVELAAWSADDWGRAATVAATLLAAALSLDSRLQRVAGAALAATCVLMFATLVGGDVLRISLVLQAQVWRVLWLATVFAVFLLPPFMQRHWSAGPLSSSAVLLTLATWLCPSENLALVISPLAVAAAAAGGRAALSSRASRLLLGGAWLIFGLSAIDAVAVALLSASAGSFDLAVSPTFSILHAAALGGALPLLVIALLWWLASKATTRSVMFAVVAMTALVVPTAMGSMPTWASRRFDDELKEAFGSWRNLIPPGSEVMWSADSLMSDGPLSAWIVLERPNYISRVQAATALFSRPAAMEIRERARTVPGVVPDSQSVRMSKSDPRPPAQPSLARACDTLPVRYFVTGASLEDAVPVPAPAHVRNPFPYLKLYICP